VIRIEAGSAAIWLANGKAKKNGLGRRFLSTAKNSI